MFSFQFSLIIAKKSHLNLWKSKMIYLNFILQEFLRTTHSLFFFVFFLLLITLIELIHIACLHGLRSFAIFTIANMSFLHETGFKWPYLPWACATKTFSSLLGWFFFFFYTFLELIAFRFEMEALELIRVIMAILDGYHLASLHDTLLLLLLLQFPQLCQGKLRLFTVLHILWRLAWIHWQLLHKLRWCSQSSFEHVPTR